MDLAHRYEHRLREGDWPASGQIHFCLRTVISDYLRQGARWRLCTRVIYEQSALPPAAIAVSTVVLDQMLTLILMLLIAIGCFCDQPCLSKGDQAPTRESRGRRRRSNPSPDSPATNRSAVPGSGTDGGGSSTKQAEPSGRTQAAMVRSTPISMSEDPPVVKTPPSH